MIGSMTRLLGRIVICAVASCVLYVALPATAADDSDLYVEYSGGVSIVRNQRLVGDDSSGSNLSGKLESETGFNVGLAFGKQFYEHLRGEVQFSYRRNDVEHMSLRNEPDSASGHIGLMALMANAYTDWDLGIGVIPYFGAGIGYGSVDIEAKNKDAFPAKISDQDSVFVWSLMAGGSYPVSEMIDLSLGYRYIATTKPKVNSNLTNPDPGTSPPATPSGIIKVSRRIKAEYDAHEVVLGLRFNF
jgi:OOP family OmpA-OmpF porin